MTVKMPKSDSAGFVPVTRETHMWGRIKKLEMSPQPGQSGYHYFSVTTQAAEDHPEFPNARNYGNFSLSPKSQWQLRRLLREAGAEVPPDNEDWEFNDFDEMTKFVAKYLGNLEVEYDTVQSTLNPKYYDATDIHVKGMGGGNTVGANSGSKTGGQDGSAYSW